MVEHAALAEAPAHPDAESVAAKLQRIRAVVGKAALQRPKRLTFAEDLTCARSRACLLQSCTADDIVEPMTSHDIVELSSRRRR